MLTKLDSFMLAILGLLVISSSWVSTVQQVSLVRSDEVVAPSGPLPAIQAIKTEFVSEMPDFSAINDVRRKKKAFFSYILPIIQEQNRQLETLRDSVQGLKGKPVLTDEEQQWLAAMASSYRVDVNDRFGLAFFNELLARVDIIPVSLALAQAANESAWGTSRFAREGNNLFGQWCFSKGCGLVPGGRPPGASYEVRKFATVSESVRSYMHNLNTHHQYQTLRELRANKRKNNEPVTGSVLAQGLYAYSIRGVDYVDELIAMIAGNGLIDYDFKEAIPEV